MLLNAVIASMLLASTPLVTSQQPREAHGAPSGVCCAEDRWRIVRA
jgi:hypothetical protein